MTQTKLKEASFCRETVQIKRVQWYMPGISGVTRKQTALDMCIILMKLAGSKFSELELENYLV